MRDFLLKLYECCIDASLMLASVEHFIKPADVGVSFGVFMSLVTGRFKTGGPLYFQAEGEERRGMRRTISLPNC